MNQNKLIDFIIRFGVALQSYGANAYRTESTLSILAKHFGMKAEFFFTPTVLMGSFKVGDGEKTRLKRIHPGGINLDLMCRLDSFANEMTQGKYQVDELRPRLKEILKIPSPYGKYLIILSFGILSAAVSTFFSDSYHEVLGSLFVGTIVGLICHLSTYSKDLSYLSDGFAAFVSGLLSIGLQLAFPEINYKAVLISSLITLVPGMEITTAMAELATNNLSSGTARLMGAIMSLLKLSFGAALATKICYLYTDNLDYNYIAALPSWATTLGIFGSTIALTVLFQVRPRDYIWVLCASSLGHFSTKFGAHLFGSDFAPFMGSFAVAAVGNYTAWKRNRPTQLFLMPGLILLVPGSIGYQGLTYLFENQVLTGIEEAFRVIVISISLVVGLFFGNAVIPPKRNL